MPINDQQQLDDLCQSCGIALSYYDIRGQLHETGSEVKQSLLAALQLPVDDDADVRRSLEIVRSRAWQPVVARVLMHRADDAPIRVMLSLDEAQTNAPVDWELKVESGQTWRGQWTIDPAHALDEAVLNEGQFKRFEAVLDIEVEMGYHELFVTAKGDSTVRASLIVTPPTCYLPPGLAGGDKTWGISLQLYALRSRRNWGIGDFADLRTAIDLLAPLGVDVVGLNPLHALFTHMPEKVSPYSPSSRKFLNPIYLDVEAIEELHDCPAARMRIDSEPFQTHLQALRARDTIAYTETWALKQEILHLLYRSFRQALLAPDSERVRSFRRFQQDGGEDLFRFGLFEALQAFFHQQDPTVEAWQQWPADYRDPGSNASAQWARSNEEAIEFYQYLQWNAEQQLRAIHERCKSLGMQIGVYRDLAIGDDAAGAACWADQSNYALDAAIGAPPDDFSPKGQNWGLPPPRPHSSAADVHDPLIQTLRANMRHAGALRIDHVMGLMRLFWVPPGCATEQGTYVAYPFAEQLGILALESQRNRCMVIGEDLGTVPDEVRHALDNGNILSYRLLYFEKDWHQGSFKAPCEYPRNALCATASHDLPTLRGFWGGSDLDIRERLDLYPAEDFKQQQRELRQRDRDEILAALAREDLFVDASSNPADDAQNDFNRDLCLAIQRYLGRSAAMLLMIQAEDLLAQGEQVNVPGTVDEYPNWRGKLPLDLEAWPEALDLEQFAAAINRERNA